MDELVHFVDYRKMKVCISCGEIYGEWIYEPEIGCLIPDQNFEWLTQLCSCHTKENQEKWPGYDFNEVITFCYCCGKELLRSGSKWARFFCNQCRENVVKFNLSNPHQLIPYGRHSMMQNYHLRFDDGTDGEKISDFAKNVNSLNQSIILLCRWKKKIMSHNFSCLKITKDVDFIEYYIKTRTVFPKRCAFQMLSDFWTEGHEYDKGE
jgi:hypothetical protein